MNVRVTDDSKLDVGVRVSVPGCLRLCVAAKNALKLLEVQRVKKKIKKDTMCSATVLCVQSSKVHMLPHS